MKVSIYETHQGYEIGIKRGKHTLYVTGIYNGSAAYTTDYTHAKHYKSVSTAKKTAQRIANGEIR